MAHYFFPASANKSDDGNSVTFALKYMAFQIARVDAVVQKALESACNAESNHPEIHQQSERMRAAEKYVTALDDAAQTQAAKGAPKLNEPSEGANHDPKIQEEDASQTSAAIPNVEIIALDLMLRRIKTLCQTHLPKINLSELQWNWSCDGLTPDGKRCENVADFEDEFYQCIYCSNMDFCPTCLQRLRAPSQPNTADILKCSPKHKWLRMPRLGDSFFLGVRSERVRVPKDVKPSEEDKDILEILYGEHDKEISLEDWKGQLAREWEITIEQTKKEMSWEATPNGEHDAS